MSRTYTYTLPLSTDEYREAVNHAECPGCQGAFSLPDHTQPMRDWHDKPHRLVYTLCNEVDRLRANLAEALNVADDMQGNSDA